jgi:hypothetical protein
LVDDAVKTLVVIKLATGSICNGYEISPDIETLVLELAEMVPAANLDGAREPFLIEFVGSFRK